MDDSPDAKSQAKMLSSLIMLKTQKEIKSMADWDGADGNSRKQVLEVLQSFISPKKMLESGKLESLLKQSVMYQLNTCKVQDWENGFKKNFSLLEKYESPNVKIPNKMLSSIDFHKDEIWTVAVSPDGSKLA